MDHYPPPSERALIERRLRFWRPLVLVVAGLIAASVVWASLAKLAG
jgi:hypothetical protein